MALNIVDAMGRLLRNNLGANRPMNAPAMRTSDPVPDWAKAQGVTQQMWDNMGAAEKKAMFENYNNVIRQPSNFGSPMVPRNPKSGYPLRLGKSRSVILIAHFP